MGLDQRDDGVRLPIRDRVEEYPLAAAESCLPGAKVTPILPCPVPASIASIRIG
jgi:hypothetical protein